MPILVAECVTKSFGGNRVLSAGSLRAEPGQVRVIFGRNGSGKSTLMKIASGWIAADSGVVHFRGRALLRPRHAVLARGGLFYLPDHELLSNAFTVGWQLELFARHFGRRTARDSAARAEIAHLVDRRPWQLSGGELRRAELALVLARGPECLLADEPYRGIAPADHDRLTRIFRSIAAEGCAVVVTGHEVPTLLEACDHVTWCTAGTTYELGPPAVAAAHEEFRRGYLGMARMERVTVDRRSVNP
ncbi:MAG TPA: ATP-binding cassette domain-containing protein [Gemmatimonadaceae bacterium]|nr:ATP-binding cassette domain-containing protein [Gemmatimonadaceae bacterium]